MVRAVVSGASDPGSSPRQGHRVFFLGKTLYSTVLFSPKCIKGYQRTLCDGLASHLGGGRNNPSRLYATETGLSFGMMGHLAYVQT